MMGSEQVEIQREVEASVVPSGTRVTLEKGEAATITQSLGGTFTVVVNGNMFRIDGKDADALGKEPQLTPAELESKVENPEDLEKLLWDQMKTCYDPEIPVNIVDLGLIYDCHLEEIEPGSHKASVKMTLTAPGCGMGPAIQADVENKILCVETVDAVEVELVWEPQWNRDMMTEAARLELGMM
ncbi:MAG: putative Fe-S cluster assembly protein SufT [Verrucomicrobiota bacterium]|jgi:probable FeS assembly SUF system protein SufT|nr:putative Fe-S cluster assembly protein SufT [Verrucomicrobiota bacterium]